MKIPFAIFSILSFLLSACTSTTPVAPTPSRIVSQTKAVTETPAPTIHAVTIMTPGWSVAEWYEQVQLNCSTYVETSWGDGPAQWGDPVFSPAGSHDIFPHLAFSPEGNTYLSDIPNHRLLQYDGLAQTPKIIPIPTNYDLTMSTPYITKDYIYIPHTFNKLGILSLDGRELKNVELPVDFSYQAPTWTYILIDSTGGLFLNGVNGLQLNYYESNWGDGKWNQVSSSGLAMFTPLIWENNFVSQGSSLSERRFLVYMHKIDPKNDFLKDPPEILDTGATAEGLSLRLEGIDDNGWAYFETARYSIPDHRGQIGKYPTEIAGNIIQSDVAPDGTIYLVVYDKEDSSVPPKIVKCRFLE